MLDSFRGAAEIHGLGGVLFHLCRASGASVSASVEADLAAREIARELDHAAHLEMLRRVDEILARKGVRAVALKGALLAERLYAIPSTRGSTDIDLLVADEDLDRAAAALGGVGYVRSTAPEEAIFRRERHHIHLEHATAISLELHFAAYRGFGSVLEGKALVDRAAPWRDMRAVHVLAPDDELVYLIVHAAAHRFGRLSWLYDIKLLLATMTDAEIANAARRARESGFAHVVSLGAALLIDVAGVPAARVAALLLGDGVRRAIAGSLAPEPASVPLRAATRLLYTMALCPSVSAAARHAKSVLVDKVRRVGASGS